MTDKRRPEWTPEGAGREFASHVMAATEKADAPTKSMPTWQNKNMDVNGLANGVLGGNRTALSRAITLIESNSRKHFETGQELIRLLLPASGNSIRIGITGMPGAGKSTFIESFGLRMISAGHKVAVLAIDPSSTISKGSILGDKTRMESLSRNDDSFIRPSPSRGVLGGVARKTRESIILCEAAGYDVIIIETVGVGQSETTVRSMVDFFLLIQIAGAGDELQGIKKGIMELADLILVNKADGDTILAAQRAAGELSHALHYIRPATLGWKTQAKTCSAFTGDGLVEVISILDEFIANTKSSGVFNERRKEQVLNWFDTLLNESILSQFYSQPGVTLLVSELRQKVYSGIIPVVSAVSRLTDGID